MPESLDSGNAIVVTELTKRFNGFTAVDHIRFSVASGELFGFLGPNGAGKSTTTYMLATILKPTSGEATVNHFDILKQPDEVRKSIGMVFQDQTLDFRLSAFDNLDIHGRMYGMPGPIRRTRIDEVLALVELSDWKHKLVKTFSGGMRRRLEIGRGLLHTPKILFLDEPTLGLDVQTRRHMWSYIEKLKQQGITIILSTHYLEEADSLSDRIAIIDHGKIVALDTPKNLKNRLGEQAVKVQSKNPEQLLAAVKTSPLFSKAIRTNNVVSIEVPDGGVAIPAVVSLAEKNAIIIESISVHTPTLEDVFIALTGEQIREDAAAPSGMMAAVRKRGF